MLFLINKEDFNTIIEAVPSIKNPAERVFILYGFLSILPFIQVCCIGVFPPFVGLLTCVHLVLSIMMLVYACIGLQIIYENPEWHA